MLPFNIQMNILASVSFAKNKHETERKACRALPAWEVNVGLTFRGATDMKANARLLQGPDPCWRETLKDQTQGFKVTSPGAKGQAGDLLMAAKQIHSSTEAKLKAAAF